MTSQVSSEQHGRTGARAGNGHANVDELNRELNRANSDLVNLFDSIQTAIVLVDSDLRIRRFTPLAETLLNLQPADVGRPLADINLNLDQATDLGPLLQDVLKNVELRELEVRDREGRWYSLRLRPYRTLDGAIDGVVVVAVDIDLLKRAHNYTESIVATVREPLLVLNADLTVRSASASFYQTYQVEPQETIGRHFYELGHGQWDIKDLRRLLEELLPRDHEVKDFEVEYRFDGTGVRTARLNARRLVQLKEHDPLILLAIEDITESKRQADALRQLASDLSEADRRKNEFLAMLAHELRNPLAPILTSVEILRMPGAKADARAPAFAMLTRQVHQMVRLIDDLLDVSRISLGKIELRRELTDLGTLVTHVADSVRSKLSGSDQTLMVSMPPEPIHVVVDPTRISQVFGNLLNNASKFSPHGTPVHVTIERDGDTAVVRVRDRGMGIVPDQLKRIFDLFVQGDTSLERSVSGLGIGLTLVRRLVESHGGTVEVNSEGVGKGCEFVVRLPSAADVAEPEGSSTAIKPSGVPVIRRVLVVDDNKDAADSLSILLQIHGHQVEIALDGEAALVAAEVFRPEVILLDIGLPKLNGYEVCRRIRAQPWGREIVILAATGWGESSARKASEDAGFTGHMVKPINLSELDTYLS